jgi:hypothetical protein
MNSLTIEIPAVLVPHTESALARLGYLLADVEWGLETGGNRLTARYEPERHNPEALRKEALLYGTSLAVMGNRIPLISNAFPIALRQSLAYCLLCK